MAKQPDITKEDLLADIRISIVKALDERLPDLAGALFRLQGSAQGWCDLEDCGSCALAPLMCVNGLEERVFDLIEEHHRTKLETQNSVICPSPGSLSKLNTTRKKASSIPVAAYFERLQDILSDELPQPHYTAFDQSASGHKLNWQRVNEAFLEPFPNAPSDEHK